MPMIAPSVLVEELTDVSFLKMMPALVRTSLVSGSDNRPALLVLTDTTLYIGGTRFTAGRYSRIPLRSIVDAKKSGTSLWECIKVTHLEVAGEKTIYICPFSGKAQTPKKDGQQLQELLSHLNRR